MPTTLDLGALKSMLPGAAQYWIASGFEVSDHGAVLTGPEVADTRISISSDQSFDSYQGALARFQAPDLPPDENVFWQQVWFDIRFLYALRAGRPHHLHRSRNCRARGAGLDRPDICPIDGGVRAFSFEGDPGVIYLDPALDRCGTTVSGARRAGRAERRRLSPFALLSRTSVSPVIGISFRPSRPSRAGSRSHCCSRWPAWRRTRSGSNRWSRCWPRPRSCWPRSRTSSGRVTPRRRALFALGAGSVFGFICAASPRRGASIWRLRTSPSPRWPLAPAWC